MNKLESNKKKKKEALFNTAFELFMTKGINKTTISDIVQKAGVAKGTFYLYFADKYDVKNKLISYKAGELFLKAKQELEKTDIIDLEDKILFIIDYIIDAFNQDKSLLRFIAKNLSWGVFRSALNTPINPETDSHSFYEEYLKMVSESEKEYKEPELMLFTIIELVSGTCYSCILSNQPLPIQQYKPYLYRTIKTIFYNHSYQFSFS